MPDRLLLTDLTAATMVPGAGGYGLIEQAAICVEGAAIRWVGSAGDVPEEFRNVPVRSLDGRLVTPALIDCHTHIVHGGDRAREFEMRLEGASYEEIARAGGGIVSTVSATRAADEATLLADALLRVDALIAEGVGCIEIKSGRLAHMLKDILFSSLTVLIFRS